MLLRNNQKHFIIVFGLYTINHMDKVEFVSKAERERLAILRLQERAPKRAAPLPYSEVRPLSDVARRLMEIPEKKKRRINNKDFNFDWEPKDDTSQPLQGIVYGRRKVRLSFAS